MSLAQKDNVTVAIQSSLTVPLVMPVLDSIDDGALRKDIAEEAVRLSIMESLCGFDGVRVEEAVTPLPNGKGACSFRADVDFNKLARCIGALQSEYQRVAGIAKDAHALVVELHKNIDIEQIETRTALEEVRDGLKSIIEPPGDKGDSGDERADMPELVDEQVEKRRLLDASDSSDDDEGSPENRGYTRMSDDE